MEQMTISVPTIFFLDCLSKIQKKSSDFGFSAITLLILKELAPNWACIIRRTYLIKSIKKMINSVPNLGSGH